MLQNFNYKGQIIQRREDGFISLTQMCVVSGKRLDVFMKTKRAQAYIEALANYHQKVVVETEEGSSGGTWGHPSLAINLARWISPDFAVWCDAHIFNLIADGQTSLAQNPIEEMQKKLGLLTGVKDLLEGLNQLDTRSELMIADQARDLLMPTQHAVNTPREITITERALDLGYRLTRSQAIAAGRAAVKAYKAKHEGSAPPTRQQFVDGAPRQVKSYTTLDLDVLDQAIHSVMG